MRKPTFIEDLWWTSASTPFDPNSDAYFAHVAAGTKMEEHGWVLVGKAEITYEVFDNIDPLKAQIAALDAKIEEVQAEAGMKVNQLRQMKANLLALPGPGGDN